MKKFEHMNDVEIELQPEFTVTGSIIGSGNVVMCCSPTLTGTWHGPNIAEGNNLYYTNDRVADIIATLARSN